MHGSYIPHLFLFLNQKKYLNQSVCDGVGGISEEHYCSNTQKSNILMLTYVVTRRCVTFAT